MVNPLNSAVFDPSGYDIHRASHGFSMALIEIDGVYLLYNSMVDLSMANCEISRWYIPVISITTTKFA